LMNSNHRILLYGIYGFLLGLVFPIIATVLRFHELGTQFSAKMLAAVHLSEPLMLIIDLAPVILGVSFSLIGIQAARHYQTSQELEDHISREKDKTEYEQYFLEALINSSSFAIVRLDTSHHIITCNQQFEELFGYSCDEIIGKQLDDMIATEDLLAEASNVSASVSRGNLVRLVSKRKRKDGSLVDVEIVGIPVSVGGEKIGIIGLYNDISAQLEAQQAINESESRFRSLFQDSPISLWEEDFSGVREILQAIGNQQEIIKQLETDISLVQECLQAVKVLDVNQATLDLYNARSKSELLAGLSNILVDDSLKEFRNELIALVNGKEFFECEILQKKVTGELIHGWLRFSLPREYKENWKRVFISIMDITDRKLTEQKMRYLSFHDQLTGLYNRAYFEEELRRLEHGRQYPISIIACDLDGLKQINDNLGHSTGDKAIQAAAKILGGDTFRNEDVVARTGGDEFVIILPAVDLNENPSVLERIESRITAHNASKNEDGLYRPISLSFGYAVAYQGSSLEQTVNQADRAMYDQKSSKYPPRQRIP